MLSQLTRDHPKARVSGPALDELMARHDGLVHAVLRRQWGGSLDYEARLQVGRIGLWHALVGYDPKRGTAFSTYAWPAIEHEIWRAVRQVGSVSLAPLVESLPSLSDEPDEANRFPCGAGGRNGHSLRIPLLGVMDIPVGLCYHAATQPTVAGLT